MDYNDAKFVSCSVYMQNFILYCFRFLGKWYLRIFFFKTFLWLYGLFTETQE